MARHSRKRHRMRRGGGGRRCGLRALVLWARSPQGRRVRESLRRFEELAALRRVSWVARGVLCGEVWVPDLVEAVREAWASPHRAPLALDLPAAPGSLAQVRVEFGTCAVALREALAELGVRLRKEMERRALGLAAGDDVAEFKLRMLGTPWTAGDAQEADGTSADQGAV